MPPSTTTDTCLSVRIAPIAKTAKPNPTFATCPDSNHPHHRRPNHPLFSSSSSSSFSSWTARSEIEQEVDFRRNNSFPHTMFLLSNDISAIVLYNTANSSASSSSSSALLFFACCTQSFPTKLPSVLYWVSVWNTTDPSKVIGSSNRFWHVVLRSTWIKPFIATRTANTSILPRPASPWQKAYVRSAPISTSRSNPKLQSQIFTSYHIRMCTVQHIYFIKRSHAFKSAAVISVGVIVLTFFLRWNEWTYPPSDLISLKIVSHHWILTILILSLFDDDFAIDDSGDLTIHAACNIFSKIDDDDDCLGGVASSLSLCCCCLAKLLILNGADVNAIDRYLVSVLHSWLTTDTALQN